MVSSCIGSSVCSNVIQRSKKLQSKITYSVLPFDAVGLGERLILQPVGPVGLSFIQSTWGREAQLR